MTIDQNFTFQRDIRMGITLFFVCLTECLTVHQIFTNKCQKPHFFVLKRVGVCTIMMMYQNIQKKEWDYEENLFACKD